MNNAFFGKTMENLRKIRDIKLVTTKTRKNFLVSEPNNHTTIFFRKFISHRNKRVSLSLSILEISKTGMYEF